MGVTMTSSGYVTGLETTTTSERHNFETGSTQVIQKRQDDFSNEKRPPLFLVNLISSIMQVQAIYTAVNLGIADLLEGEPQSTIELARSTGTHAPSLYRLLRALASINIFAEVKPGYFTHTSFSRFLRADNPCSLFPLAKMWGDDYQWKMWGQLAYSVQTGKPAFDAIYSTNIWQFFEGEGSLAGRFFNEAMTWNAGEINNTIAAAYDFSSISTLIDIGGGHGTLLAMLLERNPGLSGVLFDRPPVIKEAQDLPTFSRVNSLRYTFAEGNFFTTYPPIADTYMFSQIMHNWSDEECIRILRNCRESIDPTGKILIIERLILPGRQEAFTKLLDLLMLVGFSGRERSEEEFAEIYRSAGFNLNRVISTHSAFFILEGTPM